jgi:hypothetical protein
MIIRWLTVLSLALAVSPSHARAAEITTSVAQVGGTNAILIVPARPRGAIILMAGGDGELHMDAAGNTNSFNSLVRTRMAFAQRGLAVLVPEPNVDLTAAVQQMRAYGRVTVAGTSRGTQRAARGIANGAHPDRLVLTSGFLSNESGDSDNAMNILGSPATLPPTLVVHHRQDGCKKTSPAGVDPFLKWAGGKAKVTWLDGGINDGDSCQARAHHGFNGIDGAMVSAVAGFAQR